MILLLVICCGCETSNPSNNLTHGIPNFAEVEPGVYRGGQPTLEGWMYLRSLGVTNVVKLNLEAAKQESEWTRCLSMKVWPEPISFAQQIGWQPIGNRIEPCGWQWFENIMIGLPAKGVYFHCEHGQDRTGLAVAIWRVRWDGWSKADAEKEMLAHGFHKELRGLWDFWKAWNVTPQ